MKSIHILLATQSPRRIQFFKELQLDFEIRNKQIDETYPATLKGHEITDYIALKKSEPFVNELTSRDVLITSDTLVWLENTALGKPNNRKHAIQLLERLSGKTHQVITSVAFTTLRSQKVIHEITQVTFKELASWEIEFYIDTYQPYDKAGAYGIQEWIGTIGISQIQGSYNNVVGLPTHRLFEELQIIQQAMSSQ